MSQSDSVEDDSTFERLLFSAGRTDAVSEEQALAALARFATSFTVAQSGLGAAAVLGSAPTSWRGPWLRFLAAAKWAVLGAVAGTVGTLAWLRSPSPPPPATVAAALSIASAAPAAPAPTLPSAETSSPEATSPAKPESRRAKTRRVAHVDSASDAGLAAEVTALDGVRTAMSIGAVEDAEEHLARYRRRFPRGALRNEAEVLSIEILIARGRSEAAKSGAKRFISQNPRDPQAERLKGLLESLPAAAPR